MVDLPLVGEEFAGYRLTAIIGRGGMSTVFRAENPRLGNTIALKVLAPELATNDIFRTRFLEESRIAASMNHPNVIPIHDMGSSGGLLFIAMRYVTGTDMRQMLKKRGRLPADRALLLLSQVARALDAAHRRGLVHRDVKPGNLLVERANDDTDPDHVYLADFGITKHMGGQSGLTATGQSIGTIDYVAPEQIRGISVTGLADQYSLGCVLYECLTGRVPFEKDLDAAIIWAHMEEMPTQPTMLRAELPPAIDEVFARALAKNPGDRYETCREFMAAARDALGPMGEPPTASGSLQAVPPRTGSSAYQAGPESGAYMGAQYSPQPGSYQPGQYGSTAGPQYGSQAGGQYGTQYGAQYGSGADPHPPTEITHEPAGAYSPDDYQAPTANWPAVQTAPPPPGRPSVPGGPGGPPGHGRSPERRRRRRDWLLIALALLLVAGAAAGVTLGLTGGKGTPQASGSKSPTAGAGTNPAAPGTAAAGTGGGGGSALAVPTVAEKLTAGKNPSFIQVAPNGKFAYIADPGTGAVTVLNTSTDKVSGTIQIPQGPPQFISFSPDSKTAYVSVYSGRKIAPLIAFVDTASGTVTSTVRVNNFTPGPAALSPDGKYLYVPNHNMATSGTNEDVIDVIDLASQKLTDSIPVAPNPHWIVFGQNGLFYATDHMSTVVTVLSASDNHVVKQIQVGETPHSMAISPDGSRLAITSFNGNEVYLVDTGTDKEVAVIPVGRNPLDVTYSPDGRYIFTANNEDNTVTVIDTASSKVIGELPTGKAPTSISVLPNGRQAYVTCENDGTVEVLNIAAAGTAQASAVPTSGPSAGASSSAPQVSSSPAASASMSSMAGM
ncbi:MAG TPA: protein kinase [Trebonia sp.]|jgi:serine/threonine-protein kinase